jgi:flagellar biosynthesis protein
MAKRPATPSTPRDDVKRAAALRYDHEKDDVPRLVAKGKGALAERIIEVARKNGVTIREDPDLLNLLTKLEVDQLIPEGMFRAVAEVMAYVYRINNRADEVARSTRTEVAGAGPRRRTTPPPR